jgi:hypothetical protein
LCFNCTIDWAIWQLHQSIISRLNSTNNDSPSEFGGQFKNEHGQRLHLRASPLNAYASAFENDFVKEAKEHVG